MRLLRARPGRWLYEMKFNIPECRLSNPSLDLLKRTPLYACYRKMHGLRGMFLGYWKRIQEDHRRLKFFRQFIEPGDLVFDVGANMGSLTKIFLDLKSKVVAFEPQEICSDHLESIFRHRPNFILVKKALGAKEGYGSMLISQTHMLSTLSRPWTECTKKSGRFASIEWDKRQSVEITTLDKAIQEFGIPSFVKIDVEGYEYEVLSGLSMPIKGLSIEFACENLQNTYKCIEYLASLSEVSFQFSKGESAAFALPSWTSGDEIRRILSDLVEEDKFAWGDIYIRSSRNHA